jgi:LPS sulfotransferase NodH
MLQSPIRGCKLMLFQLSNCSLTLDDLDAAFPTAKYVVLYRRSLIEQLVSKKLAWTTKQFMLLPGHQQQQAQVSIDPMELRQYCENTKRAYREVLKHSWLAERSVLLSYEELTADAEGCLSREICPLLGVSPIQPQTYMRKQNMLPLAERIANYRQVAALANSPLCQQNYAWPWHRETTRRAA